MNSGRTTSKLRVLIVDDSATVRVGLKAALDEFPDLEVVGTAMDGRFALEKIDRLRPDVITLDLVMPNLDGLGVLEALGPERTLRVVIVSSAPADVFQHAMETLSRSGVAIVNKPGPMAPLIGAYSQRLHQALRAVVAGTAPEAKTDWALAPTRAQHFDTEVVAIGASTGGPQALSDVLTTMRPGAPIVITQHLPADFAKVLAQRLNQTTAHQVKAASNGEPLRQGWTYVAASDAHLEVRRAQDGALLCHLSDKPAVGHHRPAVDVMFHSIARAVGPSAIGVLLTGMGRDGARGMLAMLRAGARTIAQDQQSCVVWGMPRAAAELSAAQSILPLAEIGAEVTRLCGLTNAATR